MIKQQSSDKERNSKRKSFKISKSVLADGFRNLYSFQTLLFLPGLFCVLLAIGLVAAPSLMISLLAAFLLVIGTVFSLFVWKFIQVKRRVEEVFTSMEGRVVLQGFNLNDFSEDADEVDEKEVIVH